MEKNKLSKKKINQRPSNSTVDCILMTHRNALGQISPALEAGLRRLGQRPKHKLVRINTPNGIIKVHHFYSGKLHLLWSPEINLRSLIPYAIALGFDWVLNWDFGYEISSNSYPEKS